MARFSTILPRPCRFGHGANASDNPVVTHTCSAVHGSNAAPVRDAKARTRTTCRRPQKRRTTLAHLNGVLEPTTDGALDNPYHRSSELSTIMKFPT